LLVCFSLSVSTHSTSRSMSLNKLELEFSLAQFILPSCVFTFLSAPCIDDHMWSFVLLIFFIFILLFFWFCLSIERQSDKGEFLFHVHVANMTPRHFHSCTVSKSYKKGTWLTIYIEVRLFVGFCKKKNETIMFDFVYFLREVLVAKIKQKGNLSSVTRQSPVIVLLFCDQIELFSDIKKCKMSLNN
jgi:hypothetical protein